VIAIERKRLEKSQFRINRYVKKFHLKFYFNGRCTTLRIINALDVINKFFFALVEE